MSTPGAPTLTLPVALTADAASWVPVADTAITPS